MGERSAWVVLSYLTGNQAALPSRLAARVEGLANDPQPHVRLRSWMSGRGVCHRGWAFAPSIGALADDERVVLSGENGARDLNPAEHLHAYVSSDDAKTVLADHWVRDSADRQPNVLLWAVSDLGLVPRSEGDPRLASEIVAVIDLLDDGDPRAVGVARQVVAEATKKD